MIIFPRHGGSDRMIISPGMVDLIVCFDASASPTRLVQRIGRAARKRAGSIAVLLTQGKEENVSYTRSRRILIL